MEDITTPDELALEIELALAEGSEDIRVRAWRLDQLLRLGFELVDACALAATCTDVGAARSLVSRGCTHRLATRILL